MKNNGKSVCQYASVLDFSPFKTTGGVPKQSKTRKQDRKRREKRKKKIVIPAQAGIQVFSLLSALNWFSPVRLVLSETKGIPTEKTGKDEW